MRGLLLQRDADIPSQCRGLSWLVWRYCCGVRRRRCIAVHRQRSGAGLGLGRIGRTLLHDDGLGRWAPATLNGSVARINELRLSPHDGALSAQEGRAGPVSGECRWSSATPRPRGHSGMRGPIPAAAFDTNHDAEDHNNGGNRNNDDLRSHFSFPIESRSKV